jgi:hypothetical protein
MYEVFMRMETNVARNDHFFIAGLLAYPPRLKATSSFGLSLSANDATKCVTNVFGHLK